MLEFLRIRRTTRSWFSVFVAAVGTLALAAPAFANAPNPIANTTKVDSFVVNSDGSQTITIEGQWDWATQTDCPTARNGVGYQVVWFDGNTSNPIGQNNSPSGILYIGGPTDNIAHSVEVLGGSAAFDNAFWDGVPASYIAHSGSSSTVTSTDAANWFSNCKNENPTTKISSGTWGPISHTYPPGFKGPYNFCPIMYDPHGGSDDSGKSSPGDLTAGGSGHNNDNSYEGNGNSNACLKYSYTPSNPAMTVVKLQRDGNSGSFTHSTINAVVGDTLNYEIQVSNTGNTPLTLSLDDPLCDSNTIHGPTSLSGTLSGSTLSPGGSAQYTCSHTLTSSDPNPFTNTATVTGQPPTGKPITGTDSVTAQTTPASCTQTNTCPPPTCQQTGTCPPPPCQQTNTCPVSPKPSMTVLKLQRDGSTGTYTTNTINAKTGDTIDYEIQVTNTGDTSLTLSLDDARCDSGTIVGPVSVSGSLSGKELSAGGVAEYMCTHVLTATDPSTFTNTATVIGTPPSGTPLSGSSSVTLIKAASKPNNPKKKTPKKKHHKKKTPKKPAHKISRVPKHPTGFTG